jgi:hypothetical protein
MPDTDALAFALESVRRGENVNTDEIYAVFAAAREEGRQQGRAEYAELVTAARTVVACLHEWSALAPPDDWGDTPAETIKADVARYLLRQLEPALPAQTKETTDGH